MEVKEIGYKICSHNSCLAAAEFEFTDVISFRPDGAVTDFKKTIVLGHSCEDHVEGIQKVLKQYEDELAKQKSKTKKKK